MDIGKLKHRITIQEFVSGKDDWGQPIQTWTTKAITWAQVQGVSGREFLAADAEQAGVTWKIILRYMPGLKPSMRILLDDQIFNITAVLPDNNKTMITVMCETGVNDG